MYLLSCRSSESLYTGKTKISLQVKEDHDDAMNARYKILTIGPGTPGAPVAPVGPAGPYI